MSITEWAEGLTDATLAFYLGRLARFPDYLRPDWRTALLQEAAKRLA